jgi:hypothetical protein
MAGGGARAARGAGGAGAVADGAAGVRLAAGGGFAGGGLLGGAAAEGATLGPGACATAGGDSDGSGAGAAAAGGDCGAAGGGVAEGADAAAGADTGGEPPFSPAHALVAKHRAAITHCATERPSIIRRSVRGEPRQISTAFPYDQRIAPHTEAVKNARGNSVRRNRAKFSVDSSNGAVRALSLRAASAND